MTRGAFPRSVSAARRAGAVATQQGAAPSALPSSADFSASDGPCYWMIAGALYQGTGAAVLRDFLSVARASGYAGLQAYAPGDDASTNPLRALAASDRFRSAGLSAPGAFPTEGVDVSVSWLELVLWAAYTDGGTAPGVVALPRVLALPQAASAPWGVPDALVRVSPGFDPSRLADDPFETVLRSDLGQGASGGGASLAGSSSGIGSGLLVVGVLALAAGVGLWGSK